MDLKTVTVSFQLRVPKKATSDQIRAVIWNRITQEREPSWNYQLVSPYKGRVVVFMP